MELSYKDFIPKKSINHVKNLINKYNINLKIVNQRKTKHGDFKIFKEGKTQITVNKTLNKYQFLLTLIHEIAHNVTYIKFGRVKPHGNEWKTIFQNLMIIFIHPDIYPKNILPHLANYLKNPKASTDSDINLSLALKNYKSEKGKCFIFEIKIKQPFYYNNLLYIRGNKIKTRYKCLNLSNNKTYLFNHNTEVKKYEE